MPSRAKDWFAQAQRDLEMAQRAADGGYFEWACFAAHQAGEKAVKALFQSIGAQVIVGHSLLDLLGEIGRSRSVPTRLLDSARILDKHYIPTRYPDAHPSGAPFQHYTKREAAQAINHADKILRFCQSYLS